MGNREIIGGAAVAGVLAGAASVALARKRRADALAAQSAAQTSAQETAGEKKT
jgi:hypothetical protein